MPRTIGELSVIGEFRRLREQIAPGSRAVLHAAQGVGFRNVNTTKDAIERVLVRAFNVIDQLPIGELVPDHPAIGALSTVLAHPYADPAVFRLLSGEKRQRTEEAVRGRPKVWSASGLEWQWAQYVAAAGERVPLDPRVPLTQQLFDSRPLGLAWSGLLDLEVLISWGLVPEVARWAVVREVIPGGIFCAVAQDAAGSGEPGAVKQALDEALARCRAGGAPAERWPLELAGALSPRLSAPRPGGAGPWTFAALVLLDGNAHVCTAGDLRVHLVEKGRVSRVTRDHAPGSEPPEAVTWPAAERAWAILASSHLHRHEADVLGVDDLEGKLARRWAQEPPGAAADAVLLRVIR